MPQLHSQMAACNHQSIVVILLLCVCYCEVKSGRVTVIAQKSDQMCARLYGKYLKAEWSHPIICSPESHLRAVAVVRNLPPRR